MTIIAPEATATNPVANPADPAPTAERVQPKMGPVRRTRYATRTAWTVLRTGRHIEAESYMHGVSDGMDIGLDIAMTQFEAAANARVPAQLTTTVGGV